MGYQADDLYMGGGVWRNGAPADTINPSPMDRGVGPMGRIVFRNFIPLTLQAAGLAALQTTAGAANLTLAAGTGVTSLVDPFGVTRYVLDSPRNVSLTSTGNISGVTFTVKGFDEYGAAMSEAITGPNNNTVGGNKAFKQVVSIAASAAVGTNTSAGFADKFGFPFALLDINYVVSAKWASALAQDAGTAVVADQTSPATTTTGDVRGTYAPTSASNGTRRLTVGMHMIASQAGPQATNTFALGVTQT